MRRSKHFDKYEERVLKVANYVVDNCATVRATAKKFGMSKSTVHIDLTRRLPEISSTLYAEVRKVLNLNKAERHLRGGMATKRKYESQK